MTAPVQVVVIGLPEPPFSGEILDEIGRLQQAGIVRLVDVLVVSHTAEGNFVTVDLPAAAAGYGELAAAFLTHSTDKLPESAQQGSDNATGVGAWSLGDVIPVGITAAIALVEHLWAAPLRKAIQRSGGTPLDETWLSADDVQLLEKLRHRLSTRA